MRQSSMFLLCLTCSVKYRCNKALAFLEFLEDKEFGSLGWSKLDHFALTQKFIDPRQNMSGDPLG